MDRMIVDYENLKQDIENIIEEMRTFKANHYFTQIIGNEGLEQLKKWEQTIKKRLTDAFSIVVIGDFKRGKSTLINALLGKSIAPTNVTPETITINKISYSEEPKIEAVLKNGRKARLEVGELKRDNLEKILKEFPDDIEFIDIKENIDFLKDISIIDTPGVGDILKAYDEQVKDYLFNADAVIYVASARSPLSLTEQSFISAAVLPQSFSRIFVVMNMADCLDEQEDIEKIRHLATERIRAITMQADVYMVSGLDEYCRKLNLKRPSLHLEQYLENNFMSFSNAINNDILMQKNVIKSERALALTKQMLKDMQARLHLISEMLEVKKNDLATLEEQYQNENSDLMQSIDKNKKELGYFIDTLKAEARKWILEFLENLKSEIEGMRDKADIELLQKYFQFYMMDLIKEAFFACSKKHQEEISEKLSSATQEFASEISHTAFQNIKTQIAEYIVDISWTNVDSTMFAVSIGLDAASSSGLGFGPLVLIGQAVAGHLRQKELDKKQLDYLSPILQEYEEISDSILSELDKIYDQMKHNAIQQLSNIYQNQVETSLNIIRQTQEISDNNQLKSEEIKFHLKDAMDKIDSFKDVLNKYSFC